MDDRIGPEPLTDAALDRALAEALDVRPSPEFLARVRMRVAEEPVPAFRLKPGVLGALAALIVIAAVLWRATPEPPALSTHAIQPFVFETPQVISSAVSGSVTQQIASASARRAMALSPSGQPLPATEVMIARDEIETIMTLVRQVQQGRTVLLAPGSAGPVEYSAPQDVVTVAPITIEPLPRLEPLQEIRQ